HSPFEEKFKELLKMGFDYFEIALDYPFPDKAEELERAIREFGVQPACHAPLDMLLACPREEIFNASMKVLEKCLRFAGKFETLYFNFHATHFSPTFIFPEIREAGIRNVEKAIKFAVDYGKNAGFDVCLENDQFFIDDFILGDVKLTLDIGHFALDIARWGNYKESLEKFVEKHGARIIVIHVHDFNIASMSDHLPLGSGELELKLLRWLLIEKVKPKYALLEIFWKDVKFSKNFSDFEDLKRSLSILIQCIK
ncbi:MAG: sugar phosphate isomerase/epimerase, partial [Archaeoglobaceae archaeon]|nr:sugar phosphate isomerase/epimerase [Archaeoglobaceae archaeon]